MLYQHSNIIESGGGGVTCRTEQSWESMRRRFTIYSIFLDIKKSIFDIKKSIPFLDIRTSFFDFKKFISWYQKIDSWNQEIGLIFFYIKKLDWFFLYQEIGLIFYIIDFFFISRNGSFFLSIFDITKYRMNSKTAPQRRFTIHSIFLLILDIKNINLSFWYKISARFFNHEFHFLYNFFLY